MKQSKRIGILLFLHARNEISREETRELLVWRQKSPENEQLFRELGDPEYGRRMMTELYHGREIVFDGLRAKFSFLSNAKLTDPDDPEEEGLEDFPEKNIASSGLSKADFWASLLSEVDFSKEETAEENGEEKPVDKLPETVSPKKKRPGRYIRIFLRAAAIFVLVVMGDFFISGFKYRQFEATMVSPNGSRTVFSDFLRGFYAGLAGIKIEETDKGEPIYLAANDRKLSKDMLYELITPPGGEFILQLPDGTRIWLNAATTIKYPANFDQDTIRIQAEGEVYIERSKDTAHHFLVIPSTINRQLSTISLAPSTRMNINNYPAGDEMRVTLINGGLTSNPENAEKGFHLLNGQQAMFIHDSLVTTRSVDAEEIIAWKNGEFYYKDAPLSVLMPAISNWYDVQIEYAGTVPDKRFNLRMPRSAALSEVIGSLGKQGLHITRQGKKLTIWK